VRHPRPRRLDGPKPEAAPPPSGLSTQSEHVGIKHRPAIHESGHPQSSRSISSFRLLGWCLSQSARFRPESGCGHSNHRNATEERQIADDRHRIELDAGSLFSRASTLSSSVPPANFLAASETPPPSAGLLEPSRFSSERSEVFPERVQGAQPQTPNDKAPEDPQKGGAFRKLPRIGGRYGTRQSARPGKTRNAASSSIRCRSSAI